LIIILVDDLDLILLHELLDFIVNCSWVHSGVKKVLTEF